MKTEHTPEEQEGIEQYLAVLGSISMPSAISNAVAAIREQYGASEYLRPTQIALLQRCFKRALHSRYEVDWYPINLLDRAMAEELDGHPSKMLCPADMTLALRYLGMMGDNLSAEAEAEVVRLERQLIITGWLSGEQMECLKRVYRLSHARPAHSKRNETK
jgi:hypothetical protein